MDTDTTLKVFAIVFSFFSLIISILSFRNNEKTTRLSILNFGKSFQEPYTKWRDRLETLELDPGPGSNNRIFTSQERRKIRDYWPKVALEELNMLKGPHAKLVKDSWDTWKERLFEGLGHQQFFKNLHTMNNMKIWGIRKKMSSLKLSKKFIEISTTEK